MTRAHRRGEVDAAGRPIADLGQYDGQYHFLGRFKHPIQRVQPHDLKSWAARRPNGLTLTNPEHLKPEDLRYALLIQPFRSSWVVVWSAPTLVALRAGQHPPEPARSTQFFPHGYWRYQQVH